METFSADWLALREPADHAARSARLEAALAADLAARGTTRLSVVDLGTGAGSNARKLIPALPMAQQWLLVDHDATLLDVALDRTRSWAEARGASASPSAGDLLLHDGRRDVHLTTAVRNLSALGDDTFPREVPLLVTGAALLDLTSPAWLEHLAEQCHERHATAFFALTYDGRIQCTPEDSLDEVVRTAVNAHQHTDKGFGPAAGPDATAVCARAFERLGFAVDRAASDWQLGPDAAPLQEALVEGWAHAATALAPDRADDIAAWRDRRLRHIGDGRSRIVVGHEDILARPPEGVAR